MFKPIDQICVAAPQHKHFSGPDGLGPITFEEHYASVATIHVSTATPKDVRTAYDLARNAFLYAWFSYDLLMVATPQALASLEMALRFRLAIPEQQKVKLATMIDQARKAGYLPSLAKGTKDPLHALRQIRNELAHGSNSQFDPNMTVFIMEMVAGTINQLFPAP